MEIDFLGFSLKQAITLTTAVLKIETDSNKRLALRAALRYLKLASATEGKPKQPLLQ